MLQIVAGAALGALATLIATWWLNRNSASRTARRETYLDLLTTLYAALRVQEFAVFDHDSSVPDIISNERIDQFYARLDIDASPEVRKLARDAFRRIHQFNASHVMRAPIEVDEHGMFRYRFDLVRGVDDESANLSLRVSLSGVRDELQTVVDRLAPQLRREVHGAKLVLPAIRSQQPGS